MSTPINIKRAREAASRGAKLLQAGNAESAVTALSEAISLDPDCASNYLQRANIYVTLNKLAKALQDCNSGLKHEPDNVDLYACRALILVRLHLPERALTDCASGLKLNPDSSILLMRQGDACLQLGRIDEALSAYSRVLELDADNCMALNNRAAVFMRMNRWQAAVDDLSTSLQMNPDDAAAWGNRGYAFAALDSHLEAIEDYNRALKMEPKRLPNLYFLRSMSHQYLGHWYEARFDLDAVVNLYPDEYSYRLHFASLLVRLGRQDEGREQLLIADRASDPSLRAQCCLLHQSIGEHAFAWETLKRLRSAHGENVAVLVAIGTFHSTQGEHEQALAEYEAALALMPSPEIMVRQSMVLRKTGQPERARDICSEVLKLAPQFTPAYRARALANMDLGAIEKAVEDCSVAIECCPADADSFTVRAAAYGKLGKFNEARADFDQADLRKAERGFLLLYRGLFYAETRETEKAVADLREALRILTTQDSRWYAEQARRALHELGEA